LYKNKGDYMEGTFDHGLMELRQKRNMGKGIYFPPLKDDVGAGLIYGTFIELEKRISDDKYRISLSTYIPGEDAGDSVPCIEIVPTSSKPTLVGPRRNERRSTSVFVNIGYNGSTAIIECTLVPSCNEKRFLNSLFDEDCISKIANEIHGYIKEYL
jgi:hypothetical protein